MPSIHRLGLALRTIRHLRPEQVVGQLALRLRGPARTPRRPHAPGIDALAPGPIPTPPSPEGRLNPAGAVALVGRPPHDPRRSGWHPGANALWSYTLHYHGWIGHPQLTPSDAWSTIDSWIREHQDGVGWEPYPTSMRILHWIGWLYRNDRSLQAHARERVLGSLAAQLEHLADHIETHIDGNHLWTNLVALVTGGLALRGSLPPRLVERFGPRLVRTVQAQLAGDGVHAERTPTYHCLLAEQLSLVVALAHTHRPRLAQALAPAAAAMLAVVPAFTHPDGDVALWGDSQLDAPVTPQQLATRTGRTMPRGHADAPVSGFSRRSWGPWTLLWNRGDVGLPHQVGHIHADALAVELSLGPTRVVVDAGVGTYDIGAERSYSRSTGAHNTVSVGSDTADQHELWASHRIGSRASPETIACAEHRVVGRVQGYRSPTAHLRHIEYADRAVRITDTLERPGPPAVVRYFVPREHSLCVRDGVATLEVGGRRCQLHAIGRRWHHDPAPGWHGMGRPAPRVCLSLPLHADGARVELRAIE